MDKVQAVNFSSYNFLGFLGDEDIHVCVGPSSSNPLSLDFCWGNSAVSSVTSSLCCSPVMAISSLHIQSAGILSVLGGLG